MTRVLPLAFLSSLALGGCVVDEPEPAAPTLHIQGGVLSTDSPALLLTGTEQLRPVAPGGTEELWMYEILEDGDVRTVDVESVEILDGAASVISLAGNHVSLRAAAQVDAGWITLTAPDGRTARQLLRVVRVTAAAAAPGGAWTDGDPLLASSPFAVWSGGQVSVALLAQADDPDFRVLDRRLVPLSPQLIPTSAWDAFDVEAAAGPHTFQVRSGGTNLSFDVDVVDTVDRLEVIAGEPQAPGGLSDEPFEVCLRARSGDAIVTGAYILFELEGDGELIRFPSTAANCARVELGSGGGMLRATLADESVQIAVPAR